ncbi:MAG: hypothetical protein PVJ64_13670 [Gemmatimonadales bacterium]|jgi:hypothetical protein
MRRVLLVDDDAPVLRSLTQALNHVGVEPESAGTFDVWHVALAGGEPEPIGLEMEMVQHLRVDPDGRRLAFSAGTSSAELWVMEDFLPDSR